VLNNQSRTEVKNCQYLCGVFAGNTNHHALTTFLPVSATYFAGFFHDQKAGLKEVFALPGFSVQRKTDMMNPDFYFIPPGRRPIIQKLV